jgi:hypothetical protein
VAEVPQIAKNRTFYVNFRRVPQFCRRFEKDTAIATGLGAPAAGLLGAAYRLESQNEAWISRIGVNYRF